MQKLCFRCKQSKDISTFSKNKLRKDGVQTYCKQCTSKRDHIYYLKNRAEQRERVKKYLLRNKHKLWNYLTNRSCVDCGENNPVVLEFDHKDTNTKRGAVSFLLGYSKCSWETILKEVKKCDIRCANCHRIKTAKQLGWYKFIDGPIAQR